MCHFIIVLCSYELYHVPFARYPAFKISVSDLALSGSPKFKYFYSIRKPIFHFIMVFCWYEPSISYRLRGIPHLRFHLVTLTFQGHQKSNISTFLKKLLCDFVIVFCWYQLSIAYRLRDIPHLRFLLVTLPFQGPPKVKYFYFFRKPICDLVIVFCWYELSISYRLPDIPHARFRLMTLTFQGHRRSNISPIFREVDMGLYSDLTICWYELSISYRLRDIPHLRFPLVTLTFQGHRRSNISPFLESRYGTL